MRKVGVRRGYAAATMVFCLASGYRSAKREGFWQLKYVTESKATESDSLRHKTAESLKQMLRAVWLFYSRRLTKCFHCWKLSVKQMHLTRYSYACEMLNQRLKDYKSAGFYAILTFKTALLVVKVTVCKLFNRARPGSLLKSAFDEWKRTAKHRAYKLKLEAQLRLLNFRAIEAKMLASVYHTMVRSILVNEASALLHWLEVAQCMSRWSRYTKQLEREREEASLRESRKAQLEMSVRSTVDSVAEGEVVQELLELLKTGSFSL